ncbi:hypothetical protein JST56_07775 [Candidatus Dependentiae bacterium]|nr:hypothetical protein [Candidatus Dependentiae bacterium]
MKIFSQNLVPTRCANALVFLIWTGFIATSSWQPSFATANGPRDDFFGSYFLCEFVIKPDVRESFLKIALVITF